MEKVTIKLQGGLCNYMFQIACAYAYSLRNNKELVLTTGDSIVIHKSLDNYTENILKNVSMVPSINLGQGTIYREPTFEFNAIPNISGNVYLDGYFQSEKYFKDYSSEVRQLFYYPQNLFSSLINKTLSSYGINMATDNTCSIHVRRGDYISKSEFHPVQNMNYYMKAIRQMPKDSIFLIFSDDISWCKKNFPDLPEKFKFIEGNLDHEDLVLMSVCKNNIMCNSSFSWWGAWLNNNPDKKIIAPSLWFGPAYANHNTSDLYCENWIKI